MIDLFRFVSLRPPGIPASSGVVPIHLSKRLQDAMRSDLKPGATAQQLLASGTSVSRTLAEFQQGPRYHAFIAALEKDPAARSAATVAPIVKACFDADAASLLKRSWFTADKAQVSDTLILVKLASDGTKVEVAALSAILRAITVIERVAERSDRLNVDPVFVVEGLALGHRSPSASLPMAAAVSQHASAALPAEPPSLQDDLAVAMTVLMGISPSKLIATEVPNGRVTKALPSTASAMEPPVDTRPLPVSAADAPMAEVQAVSGAGESDSVLTIPASLARTLDPAVGRVASSLKLDLAQTSVPDLVREIEQALSVRAPSPPTAERGIKDPTDLAPLDDPGTGPLPSLPTGPGAIVTPIGIGDLLVVRQRPLRYEGGDVAHIENVLRSEKFHRDTKRVELTQSTVTTEVDTTSEQEQDTQSTDRFALQRETTATVKSDNSIKAGVAISASYGPTVSVKSNIDIATSNAKETGEKQSSKYSKDVTTRAASKITQTTKKQQTLLTSNSFEEDVSHEFDNATGEKNISGVYQWVNKVSEAQVYNYGVRVMFDVMVPEPAAFLSSMLDADDGGTPPPVRPLPFTELPQDITDQPGIFDYRFIASKYGTTNLDPPPPSVQTISKEFEAPVIAPEGFAKTAELKVPDGYLAHTVYWSSAGPAANPGVSPIITVMAGRKWMDGFGTDSKGTFALDFEDGTIPLGVLTRGYTSLALVFSIECVRSTRAYQQWQEKVYGAIRQDYQRLLDEYNKAVEDAAAAKAVTYGHNPLTNAALQRTELKKACITMLTGQQYEAFGAIETSAADGFPQVLLTNAAEQGRYVRFLEEAFEWEQIMYFYYPYYWGRKAHWRKHALATDEDPQFSDFLNAGSARVVFPVRKGYEDMVTHLLETGQVYNGGDMPPISSELYVSIITEIKEHDPADTGETPSGDPWNVTLPTTLVKLRADDKLPTWGWDTSDPPQWLELAPA